jgi:N-acetylmuramoyl-L-alanine amidase
MTKKKIGIDIGHGEDTFNVHGGKGVKKDGKGYEEHHFNSAVGLIVKERLEELGFDIVFGQEPFKNDVYLTKRTNFYNNVDCDLVVSIHANAGVKAANGACAFYWHTGKNSKRFAEAWVSNFKETVDGVDTHGNGLHESKPGSWTNLHMCREPKMASVLLEHGFMTNDNDFEYIFGKHSDRYRLQCAEAIVKTVCEYFGVKYQESKKDAPTGNVKPSGDYKIQRGDTFYSIAKKFKVSVTDIQRANPKVNPRALQIGTYLDIPKKKAPAKPKADMKTNSIVTYLNSIGVNSSFGNREKLAIKYGVHGYKGTAAQNLELLDRMRKGKVAPKGNQTTDSIVTYLNSINVNSSFSNRERLAVKYGIKGYRGSASQNLLLLKKVRGH